MNDDCIDPVLARWYADGTAGYARSASVEAHLLACATCRATIGAAVPGDRLDRIWDGIAAELDAPRPGPAERLLTWFRVRPDTARLIVTTPSLRLNWLAGIALMLGFAALMADAGDRGRLFFLTLAPLLPVAGVAAAFSGPLDPIREVTVAVPYSRFRLLLIRALAVLTTSAGLAAGIGALLLDDGFLTAGWLLPALALVSATLALSARWDAGTAAAGVSLAWTGWLWLPEPMGAVSFTAFTTGFQLAYLLIALVAGAALVLGRHVFEFGRDPR
ncbi:zf-HC2 domain-containing protein [Catenuloplanes japonicus]|uniref:zf-HC2 domain-containing protein n=1 Tax=Catenuloplanes japonicus TaxID=33876 RepID=UPI00068A192E|nr:hypothetical protein [Catenuloplanes japonicus]